MTDYTNYGILFKKGATLVGDVASIDSPDMINETVESTNHSSGGYRTYVTGGLKEISEFKIVLNYADGGLATLITDLGDGSADTYTITYPNSDVYTFTAIVKSIKPLGSDAQSPEVLKAEVTFRPSSSATLA